MKFCRDFDTKIDLKELKKIISEAFKKHKHGAYFYGKQKGITTSITTIEAIANYISHYASYPAISERRILAWNKIDKTVTWFYELHEDGAKNREEKHD